MWYRSTKDYRKVCTFPNPERPFWGRLFPLLCWLNQTLSASSFEMRILRSGSNTNNSVCCVALSEHSRTQALCIGGQSNLNRHLFPVLHCLELPPCELMSDAPMANDNSQLLSQPAPLCPPAVMPRTLASFCLRLLRNRKDEETD